jgi:asparagine synthase (glutamine-hydrolysing)
MCGIAGCYLPDNPLSVTKTLDAMNRVLVHRGPDGEGTWVHSDGALGFAHRRLSIIDLSPTGAQPMQSASGHLVISFNGEIYNYAELRAELQHHNFRGHSDTEVLLVGIETWGLEEMLARCIGMFAFALWDARSRAVYLVRDRVGIKPLYFTHQGGRFAFGSELKALRCVPGLTWEIDRNALSQFFRFGYVPAPLSIFSKVQTVLPGSIVRLNLAADRPVTSRYWDAAHLAGSMQREQLPDRSEEIAERFETLLMDAVRLHMVADVPVGAFLSGGVDSSAVVALMRAHTTRRIHTFTIGFREAAFDESHHARAVAQHLGTQHHEVYVCEDDLLRSMNRIVDLLDEPFADISILPTLLVSELASGFVKVVLSGDGGDEMFFGYERYQRTLRAAHVLGRVPEPFARVLGKTLRRFNGGLGRASRLGGLLAAEDPDAFYAAMVSRCQTPSALVRGGVDLAWPDEAQKLMQFPVDLANHMMLRDLRTYLVDDVLRKVDRASMAVSLEARVPLLDHRVAEFALALPLALKWTAGATKWPLRQVLAKYVPTTLFERPKQGFAVPISSWLRRGLRSWAEDLLNDPQLDAHLDGNRVKRLWQEHLSGRFDRGFYVWDVLCFLSWRRRHLG